MNRKLLIALTIILGIFYLSSSCKKSSSTNASNNPNRLRLYIEDLRNSPQHVIDTFTVTYDGNNRITALASPTIKFIYTYSSHSFTLDLYENNVLSIHEILYLNSQLYIDTTFQYDNTNDTTTEKYDYNGSLLTTLSSYIYSSAGTHLDTQDAFTYDNNGNLITDTQTDSLGNTNTMSTYTYTNQIRNVSTQPFYYPAQSKNLPATQVQTDGNGNILAAISYSYTLDSSSRVTQEVDKDTMTGYTYVKDYVYY
jgi:hypothetical protein